MGIYGPFQGGYKEKGGKFPGYRRKLSGIELSKLRRSFERLVPVTKLLGTGCSRAFPGSEELLFPSKPFARCCWTFQGTPVPDRGAGPMPRALLAAGHAVLEAADSPSHLHARGCSLRQTSEQGMIRTALGGQVF